MLGEYGPLKIMVPPDIIIFFKIDAMLVIRW